MDNKKDILSQKIIEVETIADSASFLGSDDIKYVLKKCERVASATYILTSFIPPDDPLRKSIREKMLVFLDQIIAGIETHSTNQVQETPQKKVIEICALLEIAYYSSYISRMNYLLLKDHLLDVARLFAQSNFSSEGARAIPEKFLTTKSGPSSKGHSSIKDMSDKGIEDKRRSLIDIRKNERKQTILQTVEQKGAVGVKDIRRLIPGYSEKTIQRELLSLVAEGKLKKQGERRWSTYTSVK